MAKLKGKVAVVTGASKGIGAAIAAKLGSEGAKVVVNYASDRAGAERVAGKIKQSGGKAVSVQADVSNAADVKKLFYETTTAFGNVDILVNNAGVYEFRPLESVDEQHYRKIFDLNVLGLLLTTKEAVAHMNGQGGSIINVSSIASKTTACDQGSRRCDFACTRPGAGAAKDPREFAFAGRNRNRRRALVAGVRERL